MRKVYKTYSDPGHGWLAVPIADLWVIDQGDILYKISGYSYMRGKTVFLEEDRDAGLFLEAYRARYGIDPKQRSHWTNKQSKLRNYESYSVDAALKTLNQPF